MICHNGRDPVKKIEHIIKGSDPGKTNRKNITGIQSKKKRKEQDIISSEFTDV